MALEFYVEQADRSPQSGVANESIYAGELVHDDGDGVDVLNFADGNENVALARYDAEAMAAEWEEDVVEEVYDTGQRVQYQPLEDSAILRIRTIEETTDGVTSAPSISHRDVVGIVDETDADAPTSAGRVVEEGYSNDENDDTTSTTFNRSNTNFKAVGVAYRPGQRANQAEDRYDHPVRVIVFSELKE
jgi:hypothetical protein